MIPMDHRMNPDPADRRPAAEPHALVAGGGSGGHVFPGLAIAEELAHRGWQVSWAGSRQGPESRLVGERRIAFHALPARPVVGAGWTGKLRAVATLARSAWGARALVRYLGARVVVGTGGYVSAPAVVGARMARRPALLVEPNAEAGVANRWLSRLASEAAVAFDETGAQLKCRSTTTGVPVRSEFFDLAAEVPPGPPWRLLVLGGSQGARQINELVPAALAALSPEVGEVAVCHQTGERHLETTRAAYLAAGHESAGGAGETSVRFEVVSFLAAMAAAMAECHLIVSRAGAITLAEICASGRPSVLLPLALAAGHQTGNARRLAEAGAAEVLPAAATAADLAETLGRLLADPPRLSAMGSAARRLANRDAAAAIADRVEGLAGRREEAA